MQTWEELRDLGDSIERLARDHAAYSIVNFVVVNCVDHIRAIARVHEVNHQLYKDRQK